MLRPASTFARRCSSLYPSTFPTTRRTLRCLERSARFASSAFRTPNSGTADATALGKLPATALHAGAERRCLLLGTAEYGRGLSSTGGGGGGGEARKKRGEDVRPISGSTVMEGQEELDDITTTTTVDQASLTHGHASLSLAAVGVVRSCVCVCACCLAPLSACKLSWSVAYYCTVGVCWCCQS